MTDAREELERIVSGVIVSGFLNEHPSIHYGTVWKREWSEAIMSWHLRNTTPAEKVWPCEHIEWVPMLKEWNLRRNGDSLWSIDGWTLCPICGATRPAEGEKPVTAMEHAEPTPHEPPAAKGGEWCEHTQLTTIGWRLRHPAHLIPDEYNFCPICSAPRPKPAVETEEVPGWSKIDDLLRAKGFTIEERGDFRSALVHAERDRARKEGE